MGVSVKAGSTCEGIVLIPAGVSGCVRSPALPGTGSGRLEDLCGLQGKALRLLQRGKFSSLSCPSGLYWLPEKNPQNTAHFQTRRTFRCKKKKHRGLLSLAIGLHV